MADLSIAEEIAAAVLHRDITFEQANEFIHEFGSTPFHVYPDVGKLTPQEEAAIPWVMQYEFDDLSIAAFQYGPRTVFGMPPANPSAVITDRYPQEDQSVYRDRAAVMLEAIRELRRHRMRVVS